MSGIYKGLSWVAALTVLTWAVVGGLSIETPQPVVSVGGQVTASCSLLATQPLAQVYTLSGEPLGGSAYTTTGREEGTACVAVFWVDNLRQEDAYRVQMGSMSATVSAAGATDGVELIER